LKSRASSEASAESAAHDASTTKNRRLSNIVYPRTGGDDFDYKSILATMRMQRRKMNHPHKAIDLGQKPGKDPTSVAVEAKSERSSPIRPLPKLVPFLDISKSKST
jgi:hypothetical protein